MDNPYHKARELARQLREDPVASGLIKEFLPKGELLALLSITSLHEVAIIFPSEETMQVSEAIEGYPLPAIVDALILGHGLEIINNELGKRSLGQGELGLPEGTQGTVSRSSGSIGNC